MADQSKLKHAHLPRIPSTADVLLEELANNKKAPLARQAVLFLCLTNFAAFQIEALIRRRPHREGLARQSAVVHHGAEKLVFLHTAE